MWAIVNLFQSVLGGNYRTCQVFRMQQTPICKASLIPRGSKQHRETAENPGTMLWAVVISIKYQLLKTIHAALRQDCPIRQTHGKITG